MYLFFLKLRGSVEPYEKKGIQGGVERKKSKYS